MKTTSRALTDSRMRFATVVFPEPVPPEMPIIMLIVFLVFGLGPSVLKPKTKNQRPLDSSTNGSYNSPQQLSKRAAHTIAGRHHFFVIDRFVTESSGHVRDARDAEHFQTHVSRHDRFRNRAHPDRVRSKISQHEYLSRR